MTDSSSSIPLSWIHHKWPFALALLVLGSVSHASPAPTDSVHFCVPLNFEEMQARDSIYAAGKQALDLNVGPPRTVRMIYFLPNDRPYRPDVVQRMKDEVRTIQRFYGEQMQTHGYGQNTFAVESDASAEPIVHRVDGQHPDSYYLDNTSSKVPDEIQRAFDRDANIYLIVVDNSSNAIGTSRGRQAGGTGISRGKVGGHALVHGAFSFRTAAHELGHAFGLTHDFNDGRHLMSYGPGQSRLSACHAEFLSVHSYFNPDVPIEGDSDGSFSGPIDGITGGTFELTSPVEYPTGSTTVSIRLNVSDPDGLHQVLLFVRTKQPHPAAGSLEVKACRGLQGETRAAVVFEYDGVLPSESGTSLSDPVRHEIYVRTVDVEGNSQGVFFTLIEISPHHIGTLRPTDGPASVAFSPDGTMLAAGSYGENIELWNVATRGRIATLGIGSVVAFSPDGRTVAAGWGNQKIGLIQLWNVEEREWITAFEHGRFVNSIAISPDGKTLASGSWVGGNNNTIELWNLATREHIGTLGRHAGWITSIVFSPDGTTLASAASGDGAIKLWNVTTKRHIASLSFDNVDLRIFGFNSIAFSPDGKILASGSLSGYLYHMLNLWDMGTREHIASLDNRNGISSVAFSPDGATLASGGSEGAIKLWDVASRQLIANFPGHIRMVHSVSFSPDGNILASGSADNTIRLWDVSEYTSAVPPSAGSNADAVLSLDLIPNGGEGNQTNDGVTSGTVTGKDTKIAVEVFGSGVKTSLAGLLVKFDFDSSLLAFVKAESGAFGFNIPQATGAYFAATENVNLPASGFLARGEFKTVVDVTGREFSIGIDVVTLAKSQTLSNDIKTTKVIAFNSTPPPATFSISLDGDSAAGDQRADTLDVSAGETVPIQVFARDILGANGISTRFEYAEAQLTYQGFDAGSLLPSAQVLTQHHTNPTALEISVVSFGGQATADSGLVGTARFNTTDGISETTLRLVRAEVGRGDTRESITPTNIGVTLRLAGRTPDFNGDGRVDFGDFLAFGMRFGASRGDARYDAKYDLDQDGTIGFGDFLIFGQEFGT